MPRAPDALCEPRTPTKARALAKLEQVVSEIVDEMRQMPDRGEVADYIPELARVDPKSFGLVVIDAEGNVASRRRRRRAVLDPEHLQGVHADAGARQDRQPAVGAGRPRAFGKPVQLHRPAGARARHPAQSVHQRRRHRRHRRDPVGASAARGAGRDPALHAVPRRRPFDRHRPGGRRIGAAHRLSQRGARQLHEVVRGAGKSGRAYAGRLLPPLRHCHVVPAARRGRPLPDAFRRQPVDGAAGGARPSGRAASTR